MKEFFMEPNDFLEHYQELLKRENYAMIPIYIDDNRDEIVTLHYSNTYYTFTTGIEKEKFFEFWSMFPTSNRAVKNGWRVQELNNDHDVPVIELQMKDDDINGDTK